MRKDSRECALKILYSSSFGEYDFQDEIYETGKLSAQDKEFCEKIVKLVELHYDELCDELSALSDKFSLDRLFAVDKTLLLMAMAEIKYIDDVPPVVSIKECMELAKKYSSEDSVTFVNGILASVKKRAEENNGSNS